MKTNQHVNVHQMTMTALMTALICVLAPMSIPIGPVSITLQNFVIGLAVVILGWKVALAACGLYLLIGMAGLPVFSGYTGGLAKLAGPTGGYLIGFLFFTAAGGSLASLAAGKWGRTGLRTGIATFLSLAVGDAVLYLFGTVWYLYQARVSPSVAFGFCVYPFIIPDLLKFALAAGIGMTVRTALIHVRQL